MAEPERRAALRISVLRGGSIPEFSQFLADLETAYNALYWFDRAARYIESDLRYYDLTFIRGEGYYPVSSIYLLNVLDRITGRSSDQIPPSDRIEISKISIQSPGWAEVVAAANPLNQIREYLNDRHERKKDHDYRNQAENKRLEMERAILEQALEQAKTETLRGRIDLVREIMREDPETRNEIWARLGPDVSSLGKHQDRNLISDATVRDLSDDGDQPEKS